jgi:hypothetical protein
MSVIIIILMHCCSNTSDSHLISILYTARLWTIHNSAIVPPGIMTTALHYLVYSARSVKVRQPSVKLQNNERKMEHEQTKSKNIHQSQDYNWRNSAVAAYLDTLLSKSQKALNYRCLHWGRSIPVYSWAPRKSRDVPTQTTLPVKQRKSDVLENRPSGVLLEKE